MKIEKEEREKAEGGGDNRSFLQKYVSIFRKFFCGESYKLSSPSLIICTSVRPHPLIHTCSVQ